MPFAQGQSISPRVAPERLHPASMDAANAYGVVIDGQPGPAWFNYQAQLCATPRNTWIACWTQGGYEANPDQRVVAARSLDQGRTWSREIVIEAAAEGYRVPAWIVSWVVPHTGQVIMTCTKMRRSSLYPAGWRLDARGQWPPEPGADPATRPSDAQGGSPNDWCTEVFFLELSNILTEADPAKLRFRFLPEGDEGLWVPYPGTRRHFGQEGGRSWACRAGGCCECFGHDSAIRFTPSAPIAAPPGASRRRRGCVRMARRSSSRARRAP